MVFIELNVLLVHLTTIIAKGMTVVAAASLMLAPGRAPSKVCCYEQVWMWCGQVLAACLLGSKDLVMTYH